MLDKRLFPLLACAVFLFSSCSSRLPVTDEQPTVTLPPAEVSYIAPIGDASLEYTDTALLYLPSHDGIGLTKVETTLSFSLVRPKAETIIRALLSHADSRDSRSLGGEVRLSLYGANPVEVSRDVATVNLSASALQLDREQLFIVCQAIANTLTQLDDIQYVNVLVVDKPVGLDIGNTLPMGALRHNTTQDLGAVYDQLLSRRITAGSSSATPLSSNVTLYFPLQNSTGMVCETHPMSFDNQYVPDMVVAILREMALGPTDRSIGSTELPLLADLLTATPSVIESSKAAGQIIALDFAHNLEDMLDAYGISRRQCTASICYTLSTFFPNISGIALSVNGTPVDELLKTENDAPTDAAVHLRSEFSSLVYDFCTLYFAQSQDLSLVPVRRAIPYHQCTNPRTLLCELAKGPQPDDNLSGTVSVMPPDAITDTTILGFSLTGSTLLVNFAPAFQDLGQGLDAEGERRLAYALTNTLCMNGKVKNVCFFQSGIQFDTFTGEIYWSGLFCPIPV